jgi:hypothetical protein
MVGARGCHGDAAIDNRQSKIVNRKSQITREVMHGNSEHTLAIDDW